MSRAFVNEDNQEEAPIIPPRAPLPDGVINYVTSHGLELLKAEQSALLKEIESLHGAEDDKEKRFKMKFLKGTLSLLEERIHSARLLTDAEKVIDEVRFGARVTLRFEGEKAKQSFQLVGVDEADVKENKIAFTAPIARVITGKKVGEQAILQLGKSTRVITIEAIEY